MSSFTKPLTVTKLKNGMWRVERTFKYYVGKEKSEDCISVSKGFKCDGASIPRIVWPIVGHPMGKYAAAAFVHDFLYQEQDRTRKESDKIFLEAMGVLGVPWWKRHLMYRAVRLGGNFPWKRYQLKKENKK